MFVTVDRARVRDYILNGTMTGTERVRALDTPTLKQHRNDLLIMRGLFTYELINHVLAKRWNVDFGAREGGPGNIAN